MWVKTVRGYDERGRLIHEVTPTGADVQYGYDDQDRVVTVVAGADGGADAVTAYEYDGSNRDPSAMIDPVGGRTVIDVAARVACRGHRPTGVTLRFAYDEHGDLIGTTNAAGDTARLERDDAGRVRAAVTPSGHRTDYTYDEAGLLVGRRDADGGMCGSSTLRPAAFRHR